MKKNLHYISGLLMVLFIAIPSYADYIEIYGSIYSIADSAYVPNQEVIITSIDGWEENTYTDENGEYHFSMEPGNSEDSLLIYVYTLDSCTGAYLYEYIYEPGEHEINFSICENGYTDCEAFFWYYPVDSSGLLIQFIEESWGNPTNWFWDFGDGGTSEEREPLHYYEEPGIYPVSLRISNAGCTSEIAYDVWVEPWDTMWEPDCYADFYYYYLDNRTIQFEDISYGNPTSWLWDFGDGNTSEEQYPVHTYEAYGEYLATLTIEGDSCTSSTEYWVWIYDWDDSTDIECYADFYYYPISDTNTQNYDGKTIQFIDYSWGNPTAWAWDFGDGQSSSLQNPVNTYAEPGEYIVTLSIETDSCTSTTDYWIWVGEWTDTVDYNCQADFYYDYLNNENTLQFYDISWGNPYAWYWEFGDGTTSTERNPIHTYPDAGEYWVTLAIEGDSCESQIEWPVWVGYSDTIWFPEDCYAMFYPEFDSDNLLKVYFRDISWGNTITSWYWDFGDGSTSQEQYPVHTYASEGWYEITLEIIADSCESQFVMEMYIGEDYWGEDNGVCQALFMPELDHNTVHFHNLSNCDTEEWNWNFGDGETSHEHSPIHVYDEISIYTATLTIEGEYDGIPYTSAFSMEINLEDGTIKATTGIKDIHGDAYAEFDDFHIYPNPVGNEMTLDFIANSTGQCQIEIMDVSGKIMASHTKELYPGKNIYTLNTTDISEGVYLLRVSSEKQLSTKRFIK